ncbi:MAG TPA: hypothetical protein VHL34_20160 [Rhizomicrobium sp.]|jgi:hypothetical protein|nr:hypothetical protein [Rhizomicrobium sp.]
MRRFGVVAFLICLLALPACGQDATIHGQKPAAKISQLTSAPGNAERVEVGFYPTIVNGLDISGSTYDVTAYVWFKWKGPVDPTKHLEFVNLVQRYDFTSDALFEKPQAMPDGRSYQILQIHGRFFQPFELENFPFDRQNLAIQIQDEYRAHENLIYVPDTKESGFGASLEIPGWQILGWRSQPIAQDYASRFGAPDSHRSTRFPGLRFDLVIARHINYFLWKLFLPLLIVLSANWLALLIDPELVDVRTALPATSLLTMVFLQQSYSSELPEIGSLVLMDEIYAVAYLLVLATLFHVIGMASWQKSQQAISDLRVSHYDRISLAVQLGVFAAVILLVLRTAGVL